MKPTAPKQLELNCCTAFTALMSCTLAHARMPLHQYPAVERPEQPVLSLKHFFTQFHHTGFSRRYIVNLRGIQHLTKLQLFGAEAQSSSDCLLVKTSLLLACFRWELAGLPHRNGLFACERLVYLCIKGSFITSGPYVTWPGHPDTEHRISSALTTLTLLTCLKLHLGTCASVNRRLTDLEYVAHTNLKQLEIGSSRSLCQQVSHSSPCCVA